MQMQEKTVLLEDEALRDGLQAESRIFTLEEKIELFHLLRKANVRRIQVGSFVNPKRVPQMGDMEAFIQQIIDTPDILLTGLVLNSRGLERALACGLSHVSMSVSASDAHSRRNTGRSAEDALASMTLLITEAKKAGLKVRAGVQCSFGCVYEGMVPVETVLSAVGAMMGAGADEINLADTTGMGTPSRVRHLVRAVKRLSPEIDISLHLHDTRGLGLVNMFAGYEDGVRIFDVCAGGLGGCPFVKGAAGNVPAEDAVHMFESMGIATGIDLRNMGQVVDRLESFLGRQLPGRMNRVLKAAYPCQES